MRKWRPIKTAPVDGQWILVCRGTEQGVARWNGTHWSLGAMCYFNDPRYWMPLPDPPVESELQESK